VGARPEAAAYVAPPGGSREPRLAGNRANALDEVRRLEPPEHSELDCEVSRGLVTPLQAPVAIGRDIGDDVSRRSGHALRDDVGGERSEAADPVLLPRANGFARGLRVGHPRASRVEGEPSA